MTAPAPGTSSRLLIIGGASAGVGLLIKFIMPLTYANFDASYDSAQPWETKKFGAGLLAFLGAPGNSLVGGMGLADFAVILGAVAIALAVAIRGFEPRVPRPVAPQGYPQGPYPGQYAQPQPGQYPSQPGPSDQAQTGQPVPPAQGGYQQQQWGGPSS